jgi:hypothetical protein
LGLLAPARRLPNCVVLAAMPPPVEDPEQDEKPVKALDEDDIALLKTYGLGPYAQVRLQCMPGISTLLRRYGAWVHVTSRCFE